MYKINYIFSGGEKWDSNTPSLVYPGKTQSGLEHLIVQGGLTLDVGIDLLSYLRTQPVNISEDLDPRYIDAMIVFHFEVETENLKDAIVDILEKSRTAVGDGFKMKIEVEETND
jgi:hypothetical protein